MAPAQIVDVEGDILMVVEEPVAIASVLVAVQPVAGSVTVSVKLAGSVIQVVLNVCVFPVVGEALLAVQL